MSQSTSAAPDVIENRLCTSTCAPDWRARVIAQLTRILAQLAQR